MTMALLEQGAGLIKVSHEKAPASRESGSTWISSETLRPQDDDAGLWEHDPCSFRNNEISPRAGVRVTGEGESRDKLRVRESAMLRSEQNNASRLPPPLSSKKFHPLDGTAHDEELCDFSVMFGKCAVYLMIIRRFRIPRVENSDSYLETEKVSLGSDTNVP